MPNCSVAQAFNFLVEPVTRYIGYLISYESYLNDLKRATDWLRIAVEQVSRPSPEFPETVTSRWREEVKEAIKTAESILNSDIKEKGRHRGILVTARRMARCKKAQRTLVNILGLSEHIRYDDTLDNTADAFSRSRVDLSALIVKSIVEALSCRGVNIIGACGVAGMNTAVIVRGVWRQVRKEKLFSNVVELAPSKLPYKLATPKTLAIFDDLSEKLDLEKIGVPLDGDFKLLLVSKNRDILHKMGAQLIFNVEGSTEEDAWLLFKKTVGHAAEYPHLKPIAIELAQECGGSPILIEAVAKNLKHCGLTGWEGTLMQLKASTNKLDFARETLNFTGLSSAEEEAWTFFKKAVGPEAELPEIRPIALELARECFGSPFLIDAVVKALEENGWEDTLKQLISSPDKLYFAMGLDNWDPSRYLDEREVAQRIFMQAGGDDHSLVSVAVELAHECAASPILIRALEKKLRQCGYHDTLKQLKASTDKLVFAESIP